MNTEKGQNSPCLELVRRVHFSCGHRYYQPQWSESKNKEVFGSCYSEHGHGHNYALEAYITGPIDPQSGMIMNLRDIDDILKSVTDSLDHRFLNEDVPFFKDHVPTTENVALYLRDSIIEKLKNYKVELTRVRLFESQDLWVECQL